MCENLRRFLTVGEVNGINLCTMRRWNILPGVVAAVGLYASRSQAAPLADRDANRSEGWIAGGFEHAWVIAAGAGAYVPSQRIRIDGELMTTMVSPFSGGRFVAGITWNPSRHPWLGVGLRGELGLPWAVDSLGTLVGMDGALVVQPGIYRPTWSAALELGARWTFFSHLTPSDALVETFGDRPGSAVTKPSGGFVALSAYRFFLGLSAQARIIETRDLAVGPFVRGGFVVVPTAIDATPAPPTFPLPFDAIIGVRCAF